MNWRPCSELKPVSRRIPVVGTVRLPRSTKLIASRVCGIERPDHNVSCENWQASFGMPCKARPASWRHDRRTWSILKYSRGRMATSCRPSSNNWPPAPATSTVPEWVRTTFGWTLQTVLRPIQAGGFVLLPTRWIVERAFAWIDRYRRHSKDYERNPETSEGSSTSR